MGYYANSGGAVHIVKKREAEAEAEADPNFMIFWTSLPFKAYFNRFRMKIAKGMDSRSLWGPDRGRKEWTPAVLGSIQWWGAARVLRCFLAPFRPMLVESCC